MPVDRVSFTSSQLALGANIFRAQRAYQKAGEPATTGLRINTLSDDSGVISRVFYLRSRVNDNEQYQKNTSSLNLRLNYTDAQLAKTSDVLFRVRDLVLGANDPTVDVSLRKQIADQIGDLKTEIVSLANSKFEDKYLFAGTKSDTQPFTGSPEVFNGTSNSVNIQVTSTLSVKSTLDGKEVFLGNVGTAVGADVLTNLKDSNGVPLGIKAGDTITIGGNLGGAFSTTYAVTSASNLTALAAAVQTQLRLVGNNTEVAAVQGNGSVQVTSGAGAITGLTLSISGNTVFNTAFTFPTPIAGGAATGSSNTLKAGTGEDIFDLFDDLKTAVSDGDSTAIARHLSRLDSALDQIGSARAATATRTQQSESSANFLHDDAVRIADDLSLIQDADLATSLSELVTRETALRLIFSSTSRILEVFNSLNLT